MSANITLKSQDKENDCQKVEVFLRKGAIVLHRHSLTSSKEKAKLFGMIRKFGNKWYTKQEIVLTIGELESIVSAIDEYGDDFRDILFGEEK